MKTHIAMSTAPMVLGGSIGVLCGETLRHAEPVMVVEADEVKLFLARDCRRCVYQLSQGGSTGFRYLYFLVEGEEAKQAQV